MTISKRYVTTSGLEQWLLPGGILHREGGPALTDKDGEKQWWYHGQLHREDGPTVIYPDGGESWYLNGELHREGGPALISFRNGERHEMWCLNGYAHRTDGPAVRGPHEQWYVEGWLVDVTGWDMDQLEDDVPLVNVHSLSEEQMVLFNRPNLNSRAMYVAYNCIKNEPTIEMLQHESKDVAAMAAWHYPLNDDSLDVAFTNETVREIMCHRPDLPENMRALLEVTS